MADILFHSVLLSKCANICLWFCYFFLQGHWKQPRMAHLAVWWKRTRLSVFLLAFSCMYFPSPTHAYIFVVSKIKALHFTSCNHVFLFHSCCVFAWQRYKNQTDLMFEDLPALFGPSLPKQGLMVRREILFITAPRLILLMFILFFSWLPVPFILKREFW